MCLEIRLENLLEIFFVPQALFLFILHVCGQRCKVTIKASFFFFFFFTVQPQLLFSGNPSQWPVVDTTDPQPEQTNAPVSRRTSERHSESSEDPNSDNSLQCSY